MFELLSCNESPFFELCSFGCTFSVFFSNFVAIRIHGPLSALLNWTKLRTMRLIVLILSLLISSSSVLAAISYRFDNLMLEKESKVSCISFGKNGALWLGLDGSGLALRQSQDSKIQFYSRLLGTLPSDIVLCTYRDSKGRQWFGSFGEGPFLFDGGQFRKPDIKDIKPNILSYISGISEDDDGNMWFATTMEGLFVVHQNGTWDNYRKENSVLETNTMTDLLSFNHNTLYIATGWGLYQLDMSTKKMTPVRDNKGEAFLQKTFVRTLTISSDKSLWIGTRNGIYVYHISDSTVRHLTTGSGLSDNIIIALAQDHQGNMWAVSPKTLSMVDKNYKAIGFGPEVLGQQEFHVRAAACSPEGKMYFGTSKGLLIAEPTSELANHSSALWLIVMGCVLVVIVGAVFMLRRRHTVKETERQKQPQASFKLDSPEVKVPSVDEVFMQKVQKLIIDNMSNTDYSVENLSQDMGMTRGNLYKRILAITGISPFELMRKMKISHGKQLLEQQGGNISEIAWSVGLSPKQFSKYFKDEYGELPSQFIKHQSESKDSNNTQR